LKRIGLAVLMAVALLGSGCAFNRSNVASLSLRQDLYYSDLHGTLQKNRDKLTAGLTKQLEVSRARERELLEWQRDLAKIDVLLRVGTETKGGQQSLLMEATAADLGSVNQVLALETIDQARLDAIQRLYDAVITAVAAVQKNNQAITRYLKSGNAEFALKTLDVPALVTSISTLRDLRDQLQGAQARSGAAKAADSEKLQKNIEQVRDKLLQGLEATEQK
jgi:hypothetical protein